MWNSLAASVALVLVVTLVSLPDDTNGWAYMKEGDCPNSHNPGDVWYDGCSKCQCHAGAYACYGCGAVSLPLGKDCYMDHKDRKATYPACCEVIAVCPGDRHYNRSKIGNIIGK